MNSPVRHPASAESRVTPILLFALLSVPFLIPAHTRPIPSFWLEWWAAALGLGFAVATFGARPGGPLRLPHGVLLLAVLAASLVLQFALGRIHVPEMALLRLAYFAWAALVALAARQLAERHGLQWLADIAAPALLAGAAANALLTLLLAASVDLPAALAFRHPGQMMGGNLAQPNHLNHQLWLGLASLAYLHATRRVRGIPAFLAATLLIAASALTASRSVLLHALAIMLLAWWLTPASGDESWPRRLRQATLFLFAMTVAALLLHPVALMQGWLPRTASPTGIERFFMDGGGMGSRFAIWERAWEIFLNFPWLGAGVGELPWWHRQVALAVSAPMSGTVVEHSHNLFLQWLAESGLVVTGFCAVLLWRAGRNLLSGSAGPARWWCCALLAIAGIHSLLEYPLWYAYFLGPAALLLGAGDRGIVLPRLPLPGRFFAVGIGIAGGVLLLRLASDYLVVEKRINPWRATPHLELREAVRMPDLAALRGHSLLTPYIDFAVASQRQPQEAGSGESQAICQRALRFYPQANIVRACAAGN